jgi:hypothetical protein
MRIFTHSRGVPPKLRTSTFRAFMPDKNWSATGNLEDIIDHNFYLHGTDNNASTATSPTMDLMDCPVSGAREINGTNYFAANSAVASDATNMLGEVTIQLWVYVSSVQERDYPWVFGYSKNADDGSPATVLANNQLLGVGFLTSSSSPTTFRILWEYDSSGNNVLLNSSQNTPLDQWFHLAVVRYDDPDNAGKMAAKIYVNGCQTRDASGDLEFFTDNEPPLGGTDSRWAIGGLYDFDEDTIRFTGAVGPVFAYSEALTDADIQEDYRRGLGWATNNRVHMKVLVEDNFGNMQDLSAVPSPDGGTVDMLQGVRIDDSIDKRVTTATVNIFRDHGRVNLSPLMSESFLNRASAGSTLASRTYPTKNETSYTAPTETSPTTFLNIGRAIKVQMSRMPYGLEPDEVTSLSVTGSDWYDLVDGYVDVVDFGKDVISINVRDKGGLLADAFIESDDPESTERFVADNTALNTAIQNIVTNNWTSPFGASAPTLYEPTGANWLLSEGQIARDLVLSAINKLSSQIAWMVRYKWDKGFGAGRQDFRLTLHEPDRDKILSDSFISTKDYVNISKLSLDISGVRNVVKVAYYGPAFPTTLPYTASNITIRPSTLANVQNAITASDASSETKYGRRYMEIQEDKSSLIDTGTEANRMAAGILNDLKEPLAHSSLNGKDLVEVELNDMLNIEANNQSFDSDQNYAVSTLNMDVKDGFVNVSFGLRGTPSSGSKRHISMQRTSNTGPMAPFSAIDGDRPTLSAIEQHNRPLASLAAFGGQDPSLANQFFEMWRGGVNDSLSEPIGWGTSSGTWGTGGDIYVKAIGSGAVPGQTGSFLIDISSISGAINSDMFPVKSGTPYVVKIRAAVTNVGTQFGGIVRFYDNRKDATLVDSEALATTSLSAVDTVEEKQFYVTAPPGVAYARVELTCDAFVASSHLYVDMIRFTECEPFTRARPTADYTIPKTWIPYTAVNLGTEVYDIGNNFTAGAAHVYTAPADGIYLVSGCVSMVLTTQDQDPQFQEGTDGQNSIISIVMHNDGSSDEVAARGSPGKPVRVDEDASVDLDGDGVGDPVYTFIASSTVDTKIGLSKGDTLQLGYAGRLYHTDDYSNDFYVESSATFFDITLLNGEKR